MAVIPIRKENKLILEIDNGDLTKMEEVLKRWNFKDEQAFLRFTVSLLLETENKALWMQENGNPVPIAPAKHSIKD
jgi:hypothetical protein